MKDRSALADLRSLFLFHYLCIYLLNERLNRFYHECDFAAPRSFPFALFQPPLLFHSKSWSVCMFMNIFDGPRMQIALSRRGLWEIIDLLNQTTHMQALGLIRHVDRLKTLLITLFHSICYDTFMVIKAYFWQ